MPSDFIKSIESSAQQVKPKPEIPPQQKEAIANLVGLVVSGFDETVISDLSTLIQQGRREGINGYVLCLSRVVRHELGWELVKKAFEQEKEKVPSKYNRLFGQDKAIQEALARPRWAVG